MNSSEIRAAGWQQDYARINKALASVRKDFVAERDAHAKTREELTRAMAYFGAESREELAHIIACDQCIWRRGAFEACYTAAGMRGLLRLLA